MATFSNITAGALLISLVVSSRNASAGEPAWWTQQKRDCGLPASLNYSDWNGKCGASSPTRSQPSPPSAAEIAEQARTQRLHDAAVANQRGVDFHNAGDWAKALALFEEAARLDPDDPVIQRNLSKAKDTAEQEARYAEYRRRKEPAERAAREQLRAAAGRVHQAIQGLADSLNGPSSKHGGVGFLSGLESLGKAKTTGAVLKDRTTAPDAFGTRKAKPVVGTDSGSPEAASDQMQQGFDKAGPLTGTPIVQEDGTQSAKAIDADPRMIAATGELDTLRADRDRIDAEINRLIQERNSTKDPAAMQVLSSKLDEKNRLKQQKLVEIVHSTEKTEKLRRTIETEVAAPKGQKGPASDKKQ